MKLQSLKPRIQPIKTTRLNGAMPVDTNGGASWRFGKSSHERGYGHKWRQAREGWLRKHPLCVYCERRGEITPASVVDHIEPHRGDMALFWKSENWQSLCKSCHDGEKAREEREGRGKSLGA